MHLVLRVSQCLRDVFEVIYRHCVAACAAGAVVPAIGVLPVLLAVAAEHFATVFADEDATDSVVSAVRA